MRDNETHLHGDKQIDRDRAEAEQLSEMLDLAVSLRRDALDEITARVAHELNQPLSVIVSSVRGAARRLEADAPANTRILQALNKAAAQAKRAAEVVERVRADLGVEPLSREALDVGRVARAALNMAAPIAAARDVDLEEALDDRALPALADPQRLKQAFLVLLLEGIGGVSATGDCAPALCLQAARCGDSIEITLSHRGGGTRSAAAKTTTAPSRESGFGLSFVRSVVRAHGGDLEEHAPRRRDETWIRIRLPGTATYDAQAK